MDLQRKGYSALLVMNQNANQTTKKILEAKVKIFEDELQQKRADYEKDR
jgi:hypothetical protein